jgi:quercetin dioxygenase-like cupin family protein
MPKILRVDTGDDGQSPLEEVPASLRLFTDTEGAYGEGTSLQHATGITFRLAPPSYILQWHCAPRRQYIIALSGEAEIEVGDGTIKRIGPGDVVLAEDLTGQGTSRKS